MCSHVHQKVRIVLDSGDIVRHRGSVLWGMYRVISSEVTSWKWDVQRGHSEMYCVGEESCTPADIKDRSALCKGIIWTVPVWRRKPWNTPRVFAFHTFLAGRLGSRYTQDRLWRVIDTRRFCRYRNFPLTKRCGSGVLYEEALNLERTADMFLWCIRQYM